MRKKVNVLVPPVVLLLVFSGLASAGTVSLSFDSLPSAQGWTYVSDGASEASVFSVASGVLTQNTDTFGGAATIQWYQRSAITASLPFTIFVRARVLADSTTGQGQPNFFGFCFAGWTGAEGFGIGLATEGRIQAINNVVLPPTIDTTLFHDYLLVATPGVGFELYVDDILLATGTPRIDSYGTGLIQVGDCTRGQGAHAEMTAFRFSQVLPVSIDIKPGSDPNAVNPRSNGKIPVAILTTSTADGDPLDFDAWDVDPSTLAFGPDGASIAHSQGHAEDLDGDGDLDMMVHFKTRQTGIACGDTQATLTGETFGGQPIEGTDAIKTAGCAARARASVVLAAGTNPTDRLAGSGVHRTRQSARTQAKEKRPAGTSGKSRR